MRLSRRLALIMLKQRLQANSPPRALHREKLKTKDYRETPPLPSLACTQIKTQFLRSEILA